MNVTLQGKDCRAAEATAAGIAAKARACMRCRDILPLGARPAFQLHAGARILIVGQAPGTRVHQSGRPFTDPSGDRLRQWLGVDKTAFYDPHLFAILPAGLCYPGVNPRGGDKPPVPTCGPYWHPRIRPALPNIRLTLLVGQYGQKLYLEKRRKRTLADTVQAWREYGPDIIPTPHPSWRVSGWLKRNPWFEADVVPEIQARVRMLRSSKV